MVLEKPKKLWKFRLLIGDAVYHVIYDPDLDKTLAYANAELHLRAGTTAREDAEIRIAIEAYLKNNPE